MMIERHTLWWGQGRGKVAWNLPDTTGIFHIHQNRYLEQRRFERIAATPRRRLQTEESRS